MEKYNQNDRCNREMGCGGEKCMWSAQRSNCQEWCRVHANEWAECVTKAIRCAKSGNSSALLMVDRLGIAGQKGMFVRCPVQSKNDLIKVVPRLLYEDVKSGTSDASSTGSEGVDMEELSETINTHLSKNSIGMMSMTCTAVGLTGQPPQSVVDEWNAQYTCADLLEFTKWRGYSKKCVRVSAYDENDFLIRDTDGRYHRVEEQRAKQEIGSVMSDRSLSGTRMMFSFDILTSPWDLPEAEAACEAFKVKNPCGVSLFKSESGHKGRTFSYTPLQTPVNSSGTDHKYTGTRFSEDSACSGGVHISLDCKDFVAQWHTVAQMSVSLPMVKDGRAYFKVVMLW